jgi:hypothetical protein
MHHPDLLIALAMDRRRQCPCGAVAERPNGLCRKCQARNAWRRKTTSIRRQAARRRVGRRVRNVARLLVGALSLLQTTSKEMGS